MDPPSPPRQMPKDEPRDMAIKYFTVEEANRTLPLVSRIITDIVEEHAVWRERLRRYELVAASSRGDGAEPEEQVRLREEVEEAARRIEGYIAELEMVGCLFKGFEQGLVDFYGKLNGRDILLCWKLGEPAIEYWHELDAGYAGRQELVPELVSGDS